MPRDLHAVHFDPVHHRFWTGQRELLGVTAILRDAGLVDTTHYTEEARQRGTAVHRATHARDRGDALPPMEPAWMPYLDAYDAFQQAARPVWHAIEEPVADARLGYAGIPDRHGTLNGDPVVLDIKTGVVPAWAPLQLVAYARLLDLGGAVRRRRLVLQLLPNGRFAVREYPIANFGRDERVFLSALAVAQWKRAA